LAFVNPDHPINNKGLLKLLPEEKEEQEKIKKQKKSVKKRRREYLLKAVKKLDNDINTLYIILTIRMTENHQPVIEAMEEYNDY
jgi:hypothetical protein